MDEWDEYDKRAAAKTDEPEKSPFADDVNPFMPQPERDERLAAKASMIDTMSRVDRLESSDTARLRVWQSKYGRGGFNLDQNAFVSPEVFATTTVARKAHWGDKAWAGPRYTYDTSTGVIGSVATPDPSAPAIDMSGDRAFERAINAYAPTIPGEMTQRAGLSQSASTAAMDAASGAADFSRATPYFNVGTGYDNPLGSKAQRDLYGVLGSWGLHPEDSKGRAKALDERRTDLDHSVNEWQTYRDKVLATANSLAAEGPRPDQDAERDRIEHNQFYWSEVARAERNIKKTNEELAVVKDAELGGKGLDKTAMRAAVDAAINGGVQAFASAPLRWAGLAYGYAMHGPHRTGKPDLDNTLTRAGDQIMKVANEAFPNDPVRQFDFANKLGQGAGSMAAMLGQAGIGGLLRAGAAGQTALIAISGAMQQGVQGYDEATQAFAKVMAEQKREDGLTDIETKKAWSFFWSSLAGTSEAAPFVKNWAKNAKTRHGYILGHAGEQALEEFLQEGGQQVSQNIIAGRLYDPTRPWHEDVAENAAVGGILGGAVGGLGSAKHVLEIPAVYDGLRRQRDDAVRNNDQKRLAEVDAAIAHFDQEYGFLNGRPVQVARAGIGAPGTTTDVTPTPSTEPKIEPPASVPAPVPSPEPQAQPKEAPKHGLPPEIADHIARTNPDLARKYGIAVPLDTVPEAAPVERQTFTLGADDIAREAPARPAPSEGDLLAEMPPPPAEPAQPITRRVVTPDNAMEVETQEQIVELAALKRATGDMQPRDRSRDESQVQARDIAANLDPEQMRAERVSDTGAPIVSSDDTIISGNGRTMALEQVYRDPALAERAAAYRASLGAAAAGMTEPVRILRLPKAMPVEALRAFADKSNRPRIAMMSATERAMRDAKAAGDDVMGLYQGGDVTAPHNQQFFRAFLNKATNTAERGALSKDGRLTKEGSDRISNAILAAAYGDPELLSRMLESTDDNIRSVTGAMRDAAGAFIRMKQAMAAGEASQAFDITPQVVETARRIADLRDRGIKPAEFLAQQDAFTAIDPVVEDLLRAFYNDNLSRMISRQKLTEVLVRYADEAAKHREDGLFEDTTRPADIIAIARDRTLAADGDLFGSEAVEPGGAVAPDGDTVGRRGTDWGSDAAVGGGATGAIAQADDPVAKAVAGLTAALDGGLSLKRGDEAKLATALSVDRAMLPQVLERASERGIVNKDAATGRFTRPVTAPRSFGSGQEAEARQAIDGVIADALESVRPMMAPGQVVVPYDLLSAMPKDVQQHAIGGTYIDAQFNLGTMTVDVSRAAFQAMARMKNGLGLMRGRLAHEGGHGLIHIGRIAARLNAIMKAQRENRPVPSRSELEEIGERDNIVMPANDLFLLAERARKLAKEKGPNGEPALFWPEEQYHALYSPHVRTHQATSGRHGWSPFMYARRIDEEAAMHLIDAYVAGQRFGRKIDTPIQRFLNILRRIGNALRGLGFRTADDVLRAFTAGEHANNAVEAQNIIRASVAPHETTVPVERFDEAVPARPDQDTIDAIPGVHFGIGAMFAIRTDEKTGKRYIEAFHGSPHDFDRFDMSKIGTGEGAQAYGHGLYFADSQGVADSYRDKLSRGSGGWKTPTSVGIPGGVRWPKDLEDVAHAAIANAERQYKDAYAETMRRGKQTGANTNAYDWRPFEVAKQRYDDLMRDPTLALDSAQQDRLKKEWTPPAPGRLYQVRINADPDHFLDWDKSLSQQSEAVQHKLGLPLPEDIAEAEALAKRIDRLNRDIDNGGARADAAMGEKDAAVARLQEIDPSDAAWWKYDVKDAGARPAAAQKMRDAGIVGIKYLDQGSRGAGDGSRNYVVFSDDIIEITHKDGKPVTAEERASVLGPSAPDDGILAAISRWTPDGMVQREAAHLMADVKSFEASQWKSGLTAEEIAASMHDRYGIDVAPEDLVSGRVWWKIDEMLGSQGSDYVVPTFTGGLADIMGDPLVDVEREQTATDVDAKPDRAQVAHGVQAERAPQIVAKLTGVESKRAVELWRRNVSVPRIAETLTNERGAYVRLSDVAAALDRAGVFGHEPREPHKGMAPREDNAKQENNETVDDDGPETKPLTGREAKFWTAERDNMLLDELRKAPRPTAADIAATLSDRLGTRIGAHAVYRRTNKLRADGVVIGAGETNKAGKPPRGFPWTPEALAMLTDPELAQLTAPDLAVLINQRFGGPTLTGTAVRIRRSRMAASSDVLAAISRSQDEMEDWARALEEENERWNRGLAESGAGVQGREQDMEGGQGAARGQPAADATADVGTAADDIRRGAAGAAGVAGRTGNGGRRFDIGRAGRFGLSADGRRTVNGEQQKFFFVYKDGAAVPSDGATDETALRIMRSTNNWLAHAHLIERDPGRWEVRSVKVRKGFRGQGMATALYDAIEKQLGITMQPSGMLTDDGYAFWKKRDADAVRFHRRVGDGWLSPRQMIVWKTAANGMAEEATSTDEIERMMRINAQLNDALRKLPPEAMDPDTFAKMFAISRALPPRERANQIEQQLWHQGMAADDIATRIEAETGIKTTGADVIARNRFHSGRQSWEQKLHAAGLLTFAGERAATADLNALARAKALAKDGASRERIWDETGWFRGVDGKWRWEIDDSKTAIGRPGPPWKAFDDYWYGESASGKLGDVLRDRSGLRSAYPSIDAEHTIITMGGNSGQRGYGRITADAEDATELRSILLHEKQHGIQDAEDFARGGSPREFTPDVLAAERARLMAVNDDGGWTSVGTATGDMPDIDVGRSLYRRLAGEVEARNVQHRMNMTPEERRANPPWTTEDVPQDQQIVRFGNGPQMMASLETASERGETAVPSDRDGRIDAGKAIDDGRPVFVDERIVVAHLAAARSHLSVVPEGIRVAAVTSVVPMLNPTKESDVIVTLRDVDGWSYAIESSAALIVGGRAIFDLRSGSIVLSRFGTTRDIDKSLRGEIYHEAGHALWRRDGFSGARVALLAHANSIGTLDADMGDYLRVLGSIPLDDTSVNGITIRETYEYLYRDSDEASRQDLMDQESVAYLIEMDANGVLPAELTEAVRPILDAFAAGAYTGRSEAASEREAAQMAAVDASIGRSMRDDLDKLGYYSGALRAARDLKQGKGTPEQMLARLVKGGAKKAEIEATGLDKFIEGKKSVTKDEIVAFLEQNRVVLKEVVGGGYKSRKRFATAMEAAKEVARVVGRVGETIKLDEYSARPRVFVISVEPKRGLFGKAIERVIGTVEKTESGWYPHTNEVNPDLLAETALPDGASRVVKWSNYSLDPSNPTYRETVLHLPEFGDEAIRARMAQMRKEGVGSGGPHTWADFEAVQAQLGKSGDWSNVRSGHFDEPNITGHLMTSMTRHEGKPVYTIDQIQSDCGQKLRDGGVRDEAKIAELKPLRDAAYAKKEEAFRNLDRSDRAKNDAYENASAEFQRIDAEYRTAATAAPGHPLVNTTDQWVNTTLRRAIRQAVEADADYIAIPHGDTVLSYNPGGEHGMRGFYGSRDSEGIVPKNLRKLLQKIDRESPSPQKITEIETPDGKRAFNPEQRGSDFDREQTGFTLFPLSDKVKQSVMWEGQAMFAISDPMRGINAIIRDMAVDLGLTVKQGITTREAKAAKAKVRKDAKDAALKAGATRAEANKAADDAVAKWSGYYNPRTGVFRTPIFYNTMQSVNMLADLGGREIEKRLGADLADPIQRAAPGLPNGFQGWFRLFLTNGTAAVAQAPKFTNKEGKPDDLYNAFFDLLQDKDEVLLAKLLSTRDAIETYYKANPTDVAESMVVDGGKATSWDQFQKDRDRFGLRAALMARLSTVYTATVDDLNPVYLGVRELLRTYLANTGKKLDLASALNPYKIMRVEARHANAYASRDMEEGIRPYDGVDPRGPSLVKALMLALGVDRSAALETGAGSRYRKFSTYLVSRYAMVEWGRFRDGTKERAPTAMPPGASNANEAIAFFNSVARTYEQQHPEFSQAADMVYDFQRELLTLQRDAGLITPEKFDDLVQDREYVPFLRSFEEEGEDLGSGRVLSGGQRSIFKTKRGSSRDIIDAIASIGQKVFETRQMIAQNDAKRSLMQLAEAAGPGGGILVERLDATRLKAMGIDVVAALRQAARENGVSEQDTADFVHMAQQLLGADATATIFSRQTLTPGNNVLFFWEQGRLQAMQLGGDGQMGARLAQAMYDTINTFGQQQHKMLMGMALLTAPAQMVRMGVTTHPEFAIANIIRDAWMAFVYDHRAVPLWTQTKGLIDVARGADYVKGYMRFGSMMGGEATSYADKLRHQRDTRALTERGYRFLDKPSLVNAVSHFAELFHARNWMDRASGAAVGAVAGGSMAGPAGLVAGGIIGGLAGGHLIAKVGEASETATRARVWKHGYDRAIKNGMGPVEAAQEAAFWAHDYTDYSRHGSRTETWRSIIPFFNANVQGNDTYVRRLMGKGDYGYNTGLAYPLYRLGLKDITKLSARERQELGMSAWTWFMTVFGIGSVSMILALLYRDDERVKGAPEQMKSTHWLIPIDGDNIRETVFLRIPKPFQTVWFAQAIERMVMEQSKDNPRWLENYLFDLWNTWKPPLMPTTPGIAFDMATGVDSGTGRAIVPKWKEARLRRDQYDEYTSEFAKWLSRHTDMAPSPFYTDYMIRKLGASWANTALRLNSPGLPWYNPTKPEVGPDEMFIARRFLWAAGKGSEASRVLREMAGGEEPVMGIWQRLSIPYSKLAASAADYKLHIDRVVPDVSGAVDSMQQMTPRERGYAILGGMKGHEDAKLRMLDPVNRAAKIGQEIVKLQKEIIDDQQHSGKIGKQIGIDKPKPLPLNPSEKLAARQILTQLNMMEAHNALVLTGEAGWDKRIMFDTSDLKAEFKTALPKLYKEYEQRMTKAGVLPWRGMQAAWPSVKAAIEDDKAMDAVRKQRFDGLRAKLIGRHAQAAAMRDRLPSPYTPIGYGEAPPDVQVPSSSGGQTALEPVE